ncbi:MAG TPA: alkaline phosphatase PhoX [Actinomycetota bacterium]|nr:alkaline phosphatase PhoX [Actinomycetota bacterium]
MSLKPAAAITCLLVAIGACTQESDAPPNSYARALVNDHEVRILMSVGDRVDGPGDSQFQMVGIPDGLGVDADSRTIYMNHELGNDLVSEPIVGEPLNRGAFISLLTVDQNGKVVAGERAYTSVYAENDLVGPAADSSNDTPAFGGFCSGTLVGRAEGFDRTMYLTGEERVGKESFDGRGGQSVAVFDNELHTLPRLGRFEKENTLIMSGTGELTVAVSLEDGPTTADSQLYMYVGEKEPGASSVLAKNGLDNGELFVFSSTDPARNSEATFQQGTIEGSWKPIAGAVGMTDAELESAADSVGAFSFVRLEDGAFSPSAPSTFFFATTGGNRHDGNTVGRLYRVAIDPTDPAGRTSELEILTNTDTVLASGDDGVINPDNLGVSDTYLMVQEDGVTDGRRAMARKDRNGSIWRFRLIDGGTSIDPAGDRIVELDPPARDGVLVGPGMWESSGIVEASSLFGEGTWLFDVQAHTPTTAPVENTVEDGQLLLLEPT